MTTSQAGIDLIKQFEGCRLTAYKDSVGVLTIGYGHTNGVTAGQKITQIQAEDFLRQDLARFEKAVSNLGRSLSQNQFDALVSFAFNCGEGNLKKLCANRTNAQIAEKILLYDKAGGKTLSGLTKRRKAEQKLFLQALPELEAEMPTRTLKRGDKGSEVVWVQQALVRKGYIVAIDGDFGKNTEQAVKDFQTKAFVDGIVGEQTILKLVR